SDHRRDPHSFPTRRSSDLQPETRAYRLDVLPNAQEVRSGRLVLDRRGQKQVADALKTGAPELLVRDALTFECGLELLAPLALARSEEHTSELQSRSELVCR